MQSAIGFWINDTSDLTSSQPFLAIAEHAARCEFNDRPVHVLCFKNYSKIPSEIVYKLRKWNFNLTNVEPLFRTIESRFPHLKERHPVFIDFLLRWFVFDEYFKGEPFLSWDGDIFFNEKLSIIHNSIASSTFTASSTCFVSINNYTWLDVYKNELISYEASPDAYEKKIWRETEQLLKEKKLGGENETIMGRWLADAATDFTSWRKQFFFSIEEYLIDHLIRTARLPHEPPSENSPLTYVPQLLVLPERGWVTPLPKHQNNRIDTPNTFRKEENSYYIGDQKISFIHFQSAIYRYCAAHHIDKLFFNETSPLKSELYPGTKEALPVTDHIKFFQKQRNELHSSHCFKKTLSEAGDPTNRYFISKYYMIESDLREVLNGEISDKEGLWTNDSTSPRQKNKKRNIKAWDVIRNWSSYTNRDTKHKNFDFEHLTRPLLWSKVGRSIRKAEAPELFQFEKGLIIRPDRANRSGSLKICNTTDPSPLRSNGTETKSVFCPAIVGTTLPVVSELTKDPNIKVYTKDFRTSIPNIHPIITVQSERNGTPSAFAISLYNNLIASLKEQDINLLPYDRFHLEKEVYELVERIELLSQELELNRFDAILLHADNFSPYLDYTLLARNRDIPTIMLQHGLDCEECFLEDSYADFIALWGKRRYDRYLENSTHNPIKMEICGNAALDRFELPREVAAAGTLWLWVTRPHNPDKCYQETRFPIEGVQILEALISAVSKHPEASLLIKAHHNDYIDLYKKRIAESGLTGRIEVTSEDLNAALNQANLVFIEDTSAILEVMLHGKLIVCLNFGSTPSTLNLPNFDAAPLATNEPQLLQSIQSCIGLGPKELASRRNNFIKFIQDHSALNKRTSLSKILEFVRNAISDLPAKPPALHQTLTATKHSRVVIFGTGAGARHYFEQHLHDDQAVAFCDNNTDLQGKSFLGLEVLSPNALEPQTFDKIVIASSYFHDICIQLLSLGYTPEQIEIPPLHQLTS